jgi:Uri superfamily endonuclease
MLKELIETIPAVPGSYCLRLALPSQACFQAGRSMMVELSAGDYSYQGSAMGPGGLRARLRHHLLGTARPHWHIDWLRRYARVETIWFCTGKERLECVWSQQILLLPDASTPALRFGSSDCCMGCLSHLTAVPRELFLSEKFDQLLSRVSNGVSVEKLDFRDFRSTCECP